MRLMSSVAARLALGLALALAVGGCGARAAAGPAWPTSAEPEEDGGESLAPRQSLVVVGSADKPDKATTDDKPNDDAPSETPAVPRAISPSAVVEELDEPDTITGDEEVIELDDIVIEIEDE